MRNNLHFNKFFNFNGFQANSFNMLSEEFFDLYPVLKDYVVYNFFFDPEIFEDYKSIFDKTFQFNQRYNSFFEKRLILKFDFFQKTGLMSIYPRQSGLEQRYMQELRFERDLRNMSPYYFERKYQKVHLADLFDPELSDSLQHLSPKRHEPNQYNVLRYDFRANTIFTDDYLPPLYREDLVKLITIFG